MGAGIGFLAIRMAILRDFKHKIKVWDPSEGSIASKMASEAIKTKV